MVAGAEAKSTASSTARGFTDTTQPRTETVAPPSDQLPVYVVPVGPPRYGLSDEQLRWERERLVREWMDQPLEPQTIYFPPAPPVLGAPLPSVGLYSDNVIRSLAPYVTEPFYAPLSTRLAEEDLGRRMRARLEAYRDRKVTLLTELRAQLESLRGEEPSARGPALAEFAAQQTPALEDLETTADALRRDFFRTRFLGGGGDWNQYRAWHLSPDASDDDPSELRLRELRVLRAAIYYQEGLSLAQRRLLREVVMDEAEDLHVAGAGLELPRADGTHAIFFSPDTSRLPLPASLPPDAAAMLADYVKTKDTLKAQLRGRLVALDADHNATRRLRSLQELADEQAARLSWLEKQAERIRERLVQLPGMFAPPVTPELPGAMENRVAAYLREKNELQRIAQDRLAVALADFDRREPDQAAKDRARRRAAVVRATVESFHADNAAKITALNAEAEAIRGELVHHAAGRDDSGRTRSMDALMSEFADAFKRQQLANLYAEYRTAVLQPGLSPAQRRLLFAGAIADLKLPGAIRDHQVSPDETMSHP